MENRWSPATGCVGDALDALVYQSRLLGAEPGLVLRGGGNTSLKLVEPDFRGRRVSVLRIKGSGSDLRTAQRSDFPGVRLEDVQPLFDRFDLPDDEMVAYLGHCLMEPGSLRPSIETLLHAFLPAASVAHTHADAILSLTNTTDYEELLRDLYGTSVLLVPYRRPGFLLAKEVGLAVQAHPQARGLILLNHGLVSWGETVEEGYRRHIELVTEAEHFISRRARAARVFVAASRHVLDGGTRRRLAARFAPVFRGELSREKRVIAHYTDTAEVLDFVGSPEARRASAAGAVTPDHLLSTKNRPLWVNPPNSGDVDELATNLREALGRYREEYMAYVNRWRCDEVLQEPTPRVILVPGIGMWTVGRDPRSERMTREVYLHTIAIVAAAESISRYRSLDEADVFGAEYWPLELYKLTLAPAERELARRVALVTGGASGIGRAIAMQLAANGAQVIVTDRDEEGARAVADAIEVAQGEGAAIARRLDVTSEREVEGAFDEAALTYGGLDLLVSNAGIAHCAPIDATELADWERSLAVNATGHFLVARGAIRLFKRQGIGGNIVFISTKNVVAPGRDFAAYSAAKAAEAQLARIAAIEGGPFGIRVNMINPDAILEGTRLWTMEIREGRAKMYGISPDELEDYYRKRNLLGVRITPDDVAHAAIFLASDRSAKMTGGMLSVDGGVREAFPR